MFPLQLLREEEGIRSMLPDESAHQVGLDLISDSYVILSLELHHVAVDDLCLLLDGQVLFSGDRLLANAIDLTGPILVLTEDGGKGVQFIALQ